MTLPAKADGYCWFRQPSKVSYPKARNSEKSEEVKGYGKGRQNMTTETKKTGDPLIDVHFAIFWAKYPKKVGKQKAIDRWLVVFNKTHSVKREDWAAFSKRLCDAIDNQNRYRKRINEIYPSYKESIWNRWYTR